MLPGEELIKTSEDIVEYYVRNGLGAPIKVFYCVAAPTTNTGYTPYDLVVVPKEHVENKDVEHYTVTSSGATLVYADGAGGEFTPLGDWMRDASVFALMRQMRFFREYLIKKAFNFWRGNVRYKMYALVRAKIERKLARARRKFVPAVVEIGALCDELRTTAAITINPLVTHTLDDFTRNQETQLQQVAIPAIEAAQEKARKILERVVRDVANEAKEVAAAVAATGGIDSFVSKTKSMVALKRERHERARAHKRVDEERAMLPVLVRLADYMLTEATVEMANANLRKLLDVVERPDPKSKGALSACVAFERGDVTAFEPDERTVLATVNGTVLDGVARAVGAAPRVAYARAFQPLLEAAARSVEGQETFPLSKGEEPAVRLVEGFSPHSNDSAHPEGSASESETHNLDQPSRRAPTRKAYEGLGPMAVLLADATWLSMRASLDLKIASSFAEAREYVKTYEDLRPIHAFGASWNREEYEKAPKTVAAFRADMLVQRGWGQDLDRMKTSATAGCVFVDGKPLRTELVGTVHGMLESMKALLLVKAREEAIKAGTNFTKRIKTLLPRPEDLDGFMSLVEQHQKHAAAKASYVAEHATVEDMFGMLVEYEMKIPAADQVRLDDLNEARNGFLEAMRSAGEYVESKKAEMMKALKTGVADVEEALFREQTSLNTGMYMDRESDPAEVVQALAVVRATLDAHGAKCDLYKRYQKLFNTAVGAFSSLDLAVKEYDQKHDSWDSLFRFRSDSSGWMSNACETLELDAITNGVDDAYTAAYKMLKLRRDDQVVMRTREEIEAFRKYVPLLNEVANPALQPRHWEKIFAVFDKGAYDPEHPPTASDLLEWGALDKLEQLENIGANASKEYSLAQTLKKMTKEWEGQEFRCVPYKDTGTYVLGGSDEAQALLDDQIVKAQGMCASPFVKPFEADAKAWSATLNTLQDMLDNWLKCQQTWLYLEPIFSSEDIVKQMPEEGEKFRQVDNEWRDIMNATKEAPDVITIGRDKERLDRLEECNILLDAIQKGLSAYLEKKRLFFPRFFFLSNDEMLEILSETKDPTRVQPHLKKCFEGVAKLKFEGEDFLITAMISEEQEEVPLMNPISVADANGAVEKWLLQTEAGDVRLDSQRHGRRFKGVHLETARSVGSGLAGHGRARVHRRELDRGRHESHRRGQGRGQGVRGEVHGGFAENRRPRARRTDVAATQDARRVGGDGRPRARRGFRPRNERRRLRHRLRLAGAAPVVLGGGPARGARRDGDHAHHERRG
jgi:dynein heavy chain